MDENPKETPEWKRRVLQGELKLGKGKDLFSPIGLENVFQAPSARKSPLRRPAPNPSRQSIKDMRSSPPVLLEATRRPSQKRQKFRPNPETSANDEGELSLPELDDKRSDKDFAELENYISLPSMIPDQTESSQQQDTNETPEINLQPVQTVDNSLDSTVDRSEPKSRIFSNKSELRNEGISLVSLPALHFGGGSRNPEDTPERFSFDSRQPSSEPQHGRYSLLAHGRRKSTSSGQKTLPHPLFADLTSQSLPDDLSMGTQEFNARGGFVNLRRGGNSVEGSFLKKTLNPSILQANETSLPDSSSPSIVRHRATNSAPSTQTSQHSLRRESGFLYKSPPRTPPRTLQQQQAFSSPGRPRSSVSPLKLFDKYDTFTNDRLIRRLSKFEESFYEGSNLEDEQRHAKIAQSQDPSVLEPLAESPDAEPQNPQSPPNSFGDGDFNEYEFSHQGSDDTRWPSPHTRTKIENESGERPKLHRASSSPIGVRRPFMSPRVRSHEVNPNVDELNSSHHWFGVAKQQEIRHVKVEWKEGKRLPNSPKKPSQAKRRRISYVEKEDAINAMHKARPSLTNSTHSTMSVIGKRKDARYDSNIQFADEQILASRRILRPRAPTPGQMNYGSQQRRSERSPSPPEQHLLPKGLVERVKELSLQYPPTSPTEALAADLANFALDVAQDITSGARKTSVTTGDFFEQAKAIMQHIRSKNRSPSILEEDTTAKKPALGHIEEMSYEDSTMDRFSRPPSREGLSLRRLRAPQEIDPRIVSHLRKFEDHDGVVEGLQLPNESLSARENEQLEEASTVSDPPNIRIFSRAERMLPDSSQKQNQNDDHSSTGSKSSHTLPGSKLSASSTNQSSSASGTRSKEFIAPERVAHFLEQGVAGMTYDHSRKIWIKKKSSDPQLTGSDKSENFTENDPFEDIPDLSTDELEGQGRFERIPAMLIHERNSQSQRQSLEKELLPPPSSPPVQKITEQELENGSSITSHRSTVDTHAAGTETRATSLEQRDGHTKPQENHERDQQPPPEDEVIEIEHEISILEGRASRTPVRPNKHQQPRVVTVSFSSPVVDSRELSYHDSNEYDGYDVDSDLDLASSPEKPTTSKLSTSLSARRGHRRKGRRQSLIQASYSTRKISRIDEQEEMSFDEHHHQDHEVSFSVVLHTPCQPQVTREESKSIIKKPSPGATLLDASFQLTPLPDFTFNQSDELQPHNTIRVSKDKGFLCAKDVENRFSFAIKDLVQKITDVEPFEPYWDYLRRLDLGNRNLETLHMLDEFCGRIEELDVSHNALAQLHGVPPGLRVLSAQGNALSNLTAWGHLQNLQYLDVSGNDISSLTSFQGLHHLRELRADDNAIDSINGLAGLNGLLHLRLRRNGIEEVDMRNLGLDRLEELDLKENRITRIEGLPAATRLRRLHLGSNNIPDFVQASMQDLSLEYLDLSRNWLCSFDASNLPKLRHLNLDGNHIPKINNIDEVTCLLHLSWRDQTGPNGHDPLELDIHSAQETRTLQLSENKIPFLEPKSAFLNLQNLVIACAGLLKLSANFGEEMPNLRILNLNHNALKDLKVLLGIKKLKKLYVAGNRIARMRRTSAVLTHFENTLEEFDCRGNPLTSGFYAPAPASKSVRLEKRIVVQEAQPVPEVSEDEDDIGASLSKYLVPDQEADDDRRYYSRLDDEMALKRKAYELLVHAACTKLDRLDGLPCGEKVIDEKDRNWQRLVELGVLKKAQGEGFT